MKRALLFAVLFLCGCPLFAQTSGAFMPALPPTFSGASGGPASLGKLCTLKAGTTTTWQAVYTDSALAVPFANPIHLNSIGQPLTVNNGTSTSAIYLSATGGGNYKMILYAAGTGNTCNGEAVGAAIWTRDNVYDLGELIVNGLVTLTSVNNRQYCTAAGNFDAKFTAAAALLPSTGGIVDCSNLQGAQTISSDVFTGVAKPITLLWPSATVSNAVTITQPSTMTFDFGQAGVLSQASATTGNINGTIICPLTHQCLTGAGGYVIK